MYYAIRKGSKTGIFNSWDECKLYVTGYAGAEYKKFKNLEDAKNFLDINICHEKEDNNLDLTGLHAYVDGSYSEKKKLAGYGGVILYNGEIIHTFKGSSEKNIDMRNVAGELFACGIALKWAINNNYKEITIHHDYTGISAWAQGLWKRNKEGTINYKSFIDSISNKIKISFVKVKGHSGDTYNDMADKLAKEGIEDIE